MFDKIPYPTYIHMLSTSVIIYLNDDCIIRLILVSISKIVCDRDKPIVSNYLQYNIYNSIYSAPSNLVVNWSTLQVAKFEFAKLESLTLW